MNNSQGRKFDLLIAIIFSIYLKFIIEHTNSYNVQLNLKCERIIM
jgi:hypothetical protein